MIYEKILSARMHELQWDKVQADLLPFLERSQELNLVTLDNCIKLISEKQFQ